jgi:hypothetical protein
MALPAAHGQRFRPILKPTLVYVYVKVKRQVGKHPFTAIAEGKTDVSLESAGLPRRKIQAASSGVCAFKPSIARRRSHWLGR